MIADIQRVKIKESKLSTTEDYHITKANKRGGKEQRIYKQQQKKRMALLISYASIITSNITNKKMALVNPYLSMITLNIINNKKMRK